MDGDSFYHKKCMLPIFLEEEAKVDSSLADKVTL